MFEDLEEFTALEILELGDGGTYELYPISYKLGKYFIRTAYQPEGKTIRILRIWVDPKAKQVGPNYWDITSQTLIEQMLPYLKTPGGTQRRYKFTKHGIDHDARFTLEVT